MVAKINDFCCGKMYKKIDFGTRVKNGDDITGLEQ
jgi:hypothetical protein